MLTCDDQSGSSGLMKLNQQDTSYDGTRRDYDTPNQLFVAVKPTKLRQC